MPAMQPEVDGFIERVRAAGLTRVIVRWQEEWDVTNQHGYGPVRRARLLAYQAGELLAADVPGDDLDRGALLGHLRASGLDVTLQVRNRA